MTSAQIVKVGMADLNIIVGPGMIKTIGLGSCVGITLYDAQAHVAGLAHIMLPDSSISREKSFNLAKYADTAIPYLLQKLYNKGAQPHRLRAKLAGGSQMFVFTHSQTDTMRIGPRNVESIKAILYDQSIPIVGEDTGGNYGRTIEFHNETGLMVIRSVHKGVKEI